MNNQKYEIQVSVCVVTYNQEKYISECLDSLVNQKTDFKFEIIVGEDCSTDSTRDIIKQYAEKYPNLIVPLLYEKNVGAVENVKQVYKKAQGKYIAHMDGDDMGLPGKLQKQFDVLEANPDCIMCVHNMKIVGANSQVTKQTYPMFAEKKYTLLDLYLINPFFIHSSKMFINKVEDYIDDLNDTTLDLEIHIKQAKQGNIYFLTERLGIYREFVGIAYEGNFVSSFVRTGVQSVFDNIEETRFTDEQLDKIKIKYAKMLLEYAYQCGVSIKDESLFKEYVLKSLKVKNIGITSQAFKISLLYPKLFFKAFELRKILKTRTKRWIR